jgi:prevent-host-death family protein
MSTAVAPMSVPRRRKWSSFGGGIYVSKDVLDYRQHRVCFGSIIDGHAPSIYNLAKLAIFARGIMPTKTISSTEAQNNFGRILDDVTQNSARYVIRRRNASQAVLLSLAELEKLLEANDSERQDVGRVLRELSPVYDLGQSVD